MPWKPVGRHIALIGCLEDLIIRMKGRPEHRKGLLLGVKHRVGRVHMIVNPQTLRRCHSAERLHLVHALGQQPEKGGVKGFPRQQSNV